MFLQLNDCQTEMEDMLQHLIDGNKHGSLHPTVEFAPTNPSTIATSHHATPTPPIDHHGNSFFQRNNSQAEQTLLKYKSNVPTRTHPVTG